MKLQTCFIIILFTLSGNSFSQETRPTTEHFSCFSIGEWFQFKMSYSGFLKAGNATLKVRDTSIHGRPMYHIVGKGWTTGMIRWFFKVEDRYESFIDKETLLPAKFIRKIDEGGHTKDLEIQFDQQSNKAYIADKKHNKKSTVQTKPNIQDMVSTFYYLRNKLDTDALRIGEERMLYMFFDKENYGFKVKYLGEERIKTKFGQIQALKFRPYVMAGRVFKEQESLTLWVSKDKNRVPLRIKADLAVGSLRADLDAFKGLKYPFEILSK